MAFIDQRERQDPTENTLLEHREEVAEISRYLEEVLTDLESLDYTIEGEFDAAEFSTFLNEDLPESSSQADKKQLIGDIVGVGQWMFQQTESQRIRIQLEVISSDMCQLFHTDFIKQRLLCTYRGAGTEWLDDSNVLREGLGGGDNEKIVKDFELVRRTSEFDLLILKGNHPGNSLPGAVHRSPPIEALDQKRVLLKIDEL